MKINAFLTVHKEYQINFDESVLEKINNYYFKKFPNETEKLLSNKDIALANLNTKQINFIYHFLENHGLELVKGKADYSHLDSFNFTIGK